jgi:hypothetical protein
VEECEEEWYVVLNVDNLVFCMSRTCFWEGVWKNGQLYDMLIIMLIIRYFG